ncbi:MAG: isoleucine--tRNA ligase [Bacteroidia bacterium]|nr:isoleucine--tRNA ligase [Bacteroidia bacterium]MDW8301932.1 isoleucine--tRNA ligase [Bacteroidia bacterium]
MKKHVEYKSNYIYSQEEAKIAQFWKENNIFKQSITSRQGKPTFVFYEGPPSANGIPGIHHVMSRTVKDIFCRYKTLKGYQVHRKAGWDTHGLPVELQVEKSLGITKEDIGKTISIAEYNAICKKDVLKYKAEWDRLTEIMGYWVDLENPYITYENKYIETCWFLLKKFYEKGLLYKGYTIQPYSPAAGSGLSSHELNQPGTYKNVKDTTVVAQFFVKNTPDNLKKLQLLGLDSYLPDLAFLAWTTTPWTLPSNTALALGEKIKYCAVKTINRYTQKELVAILAEAAIPRYFGQKNDPPYTVIKTFEGKELAGIEYEQLLPYVQPKGKAFITLIGDFVSTDEGTGIVHIAPTFGADDFRIAKQYGIAAMTVTREGVEVPLVDKKGRFVEEVTDFAGEYVKEEYLSDEEKEKETQKQGRKEYLSVDERIAIKLKIENKAFKVEKYEHSYPHCWRTDKPVLYYPLDSWFIKTTAIKDKLVELNKQINWKPESTGTGRFGNWLENVVDWNLSRSRFWGIPLPIWRTTDASDEICIGSVEELIEQGFMKIEDAQKYFDWTNTELPITAIVPQTSQTGYISLKELSLRIPNFEIDLHKPIVDEIVLIKQGKFYYRESDLIDVWFDSGAMPYAQWHYPFENEDLFKANFPADFIAEGVDQTRGWFYTLHVIAAAVFDSIAFKNVIANGLVLDEKGQKMSKRLGNVIDPFKAILGDKEQLPEDKHKKYRKEGYGADPIRWYMISNASPWDNLKFSFDGVAEVQKEFFGKLNNLYNFYVLYANIDGFYQDKPSVPYSQRPEIDQWILSKLHHLIEYVETCMDNYDATPATRAIQKFVDEDLSNWYVRLCRRRFWKGEMNEDKLAAYQTLYECLITVAKLMSPFAPFYADNLYKNLNDVTQLEPHISVHLADFPKYNPDLFNVDLEQKMELAQRTCSLVHSIRKKIQIPVRQPLAKILVPILNEQQKQHYEQVKNLILAEVNVKTLEYAEPNSGIFVKKIKPNFKSLGAKFGKQTQNVANAILALSPQAQQELDRALNTQGSYTLGEFTLTPEDVDFVAQEIPGWAFAFENGLSVALDTTVTPELKQEGIAREFVNRVQNLRKDLGFEVTDRIVVHYHSNEQIKEAVQNFLPYIQNEVLANQIIFTNEDALAHVVEIENSNIKLKIQKATT